MSKVIAGLLGETEQEVARLIAKLETKNGCPSHDARLIAENIQKVRQKISELGLDPDDTTGEELYHALLVRFQKNSRVFDAYFDAEDLNFGDKASRSAEIITERVELPRRWALKSSPAKSILRRHPPKHVMKRLGYRSLESMLKRQKLGDIFLGAQILESDTWLKNQNRLISRLDQTGFELRPVEIRVMAEDRWNPDEDFAGNLVRDNNLAIFGLLPTRALKEAPLLNFCLLLLEELNAYGDHQAAAALPELSPILEWWLDMDGLVADLAGEVVSLNLGDIAQNSLQNLGYADRALNNGRSGFWQRLLSRYQDLTDTDKLLLGQSAFQNAARIKSKAPEPAYEFAEDIYG